MTTIREWRRHGHLTSRESAAAVALLRRLAANVDDISHGLAVGDRRATHGHYLAALREYGAALDRYSPPPARTVPEQDPHAAALEAAALAVIDNTDDDDDE